MSADEGYTPTLLQYAEVIGWLDEQRDLVTPPADGHLKRAYDDAIQRAALGRVAKAMQAAEDAGDDGLGDMLGSWSD